MLTCLSGCAAEGRIAQSRRSDSRALFFFLLSLLSAETLDSLAPFRTVHAQTSNMVRQDALWLVLTASLAPRGYSTGFGSERERPPLTDNAHPLSRHCACRVTEPKLP